ncbi:hypothetical protein EK21DRAFT_85357 [Setomelanomma holmii]|uniref:Uncharacterized protein n=1 Tax=Setomelanomma holmii TaxID=210430 RepID=A0A9P4HH08_9PLEO|nr:hypothetical protein EK21DRAFT_85357 [Setomelanomma holmii]
MKFLYCLLPLMGATLCQEIVEDKSEDHCPLIECAADDAAAFCQCVNNRETKCKGMCPDYKPTYVPCPISSPTPTPSPKKSHNPGPVRPVKPKTCECPLVNCLQIWPGGCYCAYEAAENCYKRCGGAPPTNNCPPKDSVETRELTSMPEVADDKCECDQIMCVQMWPESCYCANAAAEACHKKCGGKKPDLQTCPPQTTLTLTTKTKTKTPKPTRPPTKSLKPTPTLTLLPPNPHKVCGGSRANLLTCDKGYTCIVDPYTPGCGPPCDGLGICVKEKMCGGFGGFACEEKGQVCVDDPRESCDVKSGGADCGGLCVWPHRSLTKGLNV